ncbi:site-specific DNA-methyltransferase [Amycolatopsis acidicola]|uniref:Site-specific DNA-methyltransferase n=1 Tax=Amycolatopsis acidicola TaxID=2596893 RepID=A0A5N0VAY3_9PSEU|nr:site-specific DNA-methyltransferase [Amycolatopsis acidicola]
MLPAKNLLGMPWRVAFTLQAGGWILRNAIVWHKPNAMPESVRDRLSTRYEMLFLLTKQQQYYFNLDPIREPTGETATDRQQRSPESPTATRCSPPDHGTPPHSRGARTPATSGPSRRAPCAKHTSPPSPSTYRCGASPPAPRPAASCSTGEKNAA